MTASTKIESEDRSPIHEILALTRDTNDRVKNMEQQVLRAVADSTKASNPEQQQQDRPTIEKLVDILHAFSTGNAPACNRIPPAPVSKDEEKVEPDAARADRRLDLRPNAEEIQDAISQLIVETASFAASVARPRDAANSSDNTAAEVPVPDPIPVIISAEAEATPTVEGEEHKPEPVKLKSVLASSPLSPIATTPTTSSSSATSTPSSDPSPAITKPSPSMSTTSTPALPQSEPNPPRRRFLTRESADRWIDRADARLVELSAFRDSRLQKILRPSRSPAELSELLRQLREYNDFMEVISVDLQVYEEMVARARNERDRLPLDGPR
ncbi:hypothetical protein JCM11251_006137 [Rhodosporidiobolus azoricus]